MKLLYSIAVVPDNFTCKEMGRLLNPDKPEEIIYLPVMTTSELDRGADILRVVYENVLIAAKENETNSRLRNLHT